jgi:ankyrin repeat protein
MTEIDEGSIRYQSLFNLAPGELLIDTFNCALNKNKILLLQGKLYLSSHFICFYSNILGSETNIIIPANKIKDIQLAKLALVIPNSIKIILLDRTEYFFTSFINRQSAYESLLAIKNNKYTKIIIANKDSSLSAAAGDEVSNPAEAILETNLAANSSKRLQLLQQNAKKIKESQEKEEKMKLQGKNMTTSPNNTADSGKNGENKLDNDEYEEVGPDMLPWDYNSKFSPVSDISTEAHASSKSNKAKKHKKKSSEDQSPDAKSDNETIESPNKSRKSNKKKLSKNNSNDAEEKIEPNQATINEDEEKKGDLINLAELYSTPVYRLADPLVTAIQNKCINLESRLDTRNRRFMFEGFIRRQGRYSIVDRWMYLLSDTLIITKQLDKEGNKLQLKQIIQLDQAKVDITPPNLQKSALKSTKLTDAFRIMQKVPKEENFILACLTKQERSEWIKLLHLAITRLMILRKLPICSEYCWYHTVAIGSIYYAVMKDDKTLLKAIIEYNPECVNEFDQEGLTALHIATQLNLVEIIKLLLEKGADVSLLDKIHSYSAIHIAAKNGFAQALQTLLEYTSVNVALYHPQIIRSKKNKNKIKLAHDWSKCSALWLAAIHHTRQYEKCLNLLLMHASVQLNCSVSAILDENDKDDRTLLEMCCLMNLNDPVETLIHLGANVDSINSQGKTVLSIAAETLNMDLLVSLIQLGGQPNLRPAAWLFAPIHYAASLEVASYLLANGARINLKNKNGQKVLDMYHQQNQQLTLHRAYEFSKSKAAINTNKLIKSAAANISQNNNHELDSCYLCSESFGLANNKREFCRGCGYIMCFNCTSHKLIFSLNNNQSIEEDEKAKKKPQRASSLMESSEEEDNANISELLTTTGSSEETVESRVCDGCFNIESYRPQTEQNKKKRKLKVKQEMNINMQNTLARIAYAITAVSIQPQAIEKISQANRSNTHNTDNVFKTAQGIVTIQANSAFPKSNSTEFKPANNNNNNAASDIKKSASLENFRTPSTKHSNPANPSSSAKKGKKFAKEASEDEGEHSEELIFHSESDQEEEEKQKKPKKSTAKASSSSTKAKQSKKKNLE